MLMMLALQLSHLWRLNRVEEKIDEAHEYLSSILDEVEK